MSQTQYLLITYLFIVTYLLILWWWRIDERLIYLFFFRYQWFYSKMTILGTLKGWSWGKKRFKKENPSWRIIKQNPKFEPVYKDYTNYPLFFLQFSVTDKLHFAFLLPIKKREERFDALSILEELSHTDDILVLHTK